MVLTGRLKNNIAGADVFFGIAPVEQKSPSVTFYLVELLHNGHGARDPFYPVLSPRTSVPLSLRTQNIIIRNPKQHENFIESPR